MTARRYGNQDFDILLSLHLPKAFFTFSLSSSILLHPAADLRYLLNLMTCPTKEEHRGNITLVNLLSQRYEDLLTNWLAGLVANGRRHMRSKYLQMSGLQALYHLQEYLAS